MVYYFYKKLTLTVKLNKNRKKTFKVQFFSYTKSNSCGVLIAYFRTGTFIVKKQQTDKEVRILTLDVSITDSDTS